MTCPARVFSPAVREAARDPCLEESMLSRIALDTGQVRFVVRDAGGDEDLANRIFRALAALRVNVDLIVRAPPPKESAALAFTVPCDARTAAMEAVHRALLRGDTCFVQDTPVAILSVSGTGVMAGAGVAAALFEALAAAGINIEQISTSVRFVTVVFHHAQADEAFAAVCRAFEFMENDGE